MSTLSTRELLELLTPQDDLVIPFLEELGLDLVEELRD
jgi:hypothetical protein